MSQSGTAGVWARAAQDRKTHVRPEKPLVGQFEDTCQKERGSGQRPELSEKKSLETTRTIDL